MIPTHSVYGVFTLPRSKLKMCLTKRPFLDCGLQGKSGHSPIAHDGTSYQFQTAQLYNLISYHHALLTALTGINSNHCAIWLRAKETTMGRYNYRNRWKNPHKAGEQMYAEKKKGKHLEGDKAGQDLTEYEKRRSRRLSRGQSRSRGHVPLFPMAEAKARAGSTRGCRPSRESSRSCRSRRQTRQG